MYFKTESANTIEKENGNNEKTEIGFMPLPFENAITLKEYNTIRIEKTTHAFFISTEIFINFPFKIKLYIILAQI